MEKLHPKFFIQNVITKQYYWRYRIDSGFTSQLSDAMSFDSEEAIWKS